MSPQPQHLTPSPSDTSGVAGPPTKPLRDIGTDFWIAYGSTQALVYSAAYTILGLSLCGSLLVVAHAKHKVPSPLLIHHHHLS